MRFAFIHKEFKRFSSPRALFPLYELQAKEHASVYAWLACARVRARADEGRKEKCKEARNAGIGATLIEGFTELE